MQGGPKESNTKPHEHPGHKRNRLWPEPACLSIKAIPNSQRRRHNQKSIEPEHEAQASWTFITTRSYLKWSCQRHPLWRWRSILEQYRSKSSNLDLWNINVRLEESKEEQPWVVYPIWEHDAWYCSETLLIHRVLTIHSIPTKYELFRSQSPTAVAADSGDEFGISVLEDTGWNIIKVQFITYQSSLTVGKLIIRSAAY